MQIQMQAFAKKSGSLRKVIADDLTNREHDILYAQRLLDPHRSRGWAKVYGQGMPGVLNIGWDAGQRMLIVRAIAKKGNRPYRLLGVFMQYLLERHGRKIRVIDHAHRAWH